jgi:hypothetical protein
MSKIINYINLQTTQTFSYDNSIIVDEVNFKNKKIPIGARLLYNDIISHSFKIANNLSKQELLVKTELKMYEDIGLDPTKAYQISYIEKSKVSDSEVLIEAFAVDKSAIIEKYQNSLKSVKHIDFIAIPFLVYETLYTNNTLTPANDIFIHISEKEAFTTSYKDGQYISSKRIKSLNDMISELENRKISLTLEELKKIIITKGLDKNNYDLLEYDIHEYLVETFEALFSKIKNLSLHNRNVYNFTQIDRVFFSCTGKVIPSLSEYIQPYIEDAKLSPLNFLETKSIDALDVITASYIKDKLSIENHDYNLTMFEKKTPFYKSEVGKLALASVASTLIISAYPIYLQFEINSQDEANLLLKEQESIISKSSKKLKAKLKNLKDEIAKIENQKQEDFKKLQTLQGIANSLLEIKSKDTKYTAMFLKINKILKNYNLSIDKITQADEHALNLELSSKIGKRDTIALLMQDLLSSGFSSVTSNEITLSDDEMYRSIVTVKR